MGIIGSAIATNAASATSCIIFLFLFLHPKNEAQFHTRSDWRFDAALFRRILRFGAPAGLQFFIDVFAFSFFALLIGRMGIVELAATNIVFSVIMLTFLPMIGFHIAISILTGQALGRHAPQEAKEVTTSALHMTFVYMLFIVAFFLLGAKPLLALFKPDHQSLEQFEPILNMGVILLRFVAFYSLFDTLNLVYSGTLKGAGDTFFVSMTILALSLFVMVIPVYWVVDAGGGIYLAWGFATAYACLLAVAFWWRYRQGHWETMSVIEPAPDDLLQEG